jgi:hypothetical protein
MTDKTVARTTDEQLTGMEAVLRMRDEFPQLVSAYNATGNYIGAMDAQAVAIMLNKFEDEHTITSIVWPARVKGEGYDVELVEVHE